MFGLFFFFQAEDGIRDLVRSRGLGDVYKRQTATDDESAHPQVSGVVVRELAAHYSNWQAVTSLPCLLYTSDAADERSSVDLGGRRILKKNNNTDSTLSGLNTHTPQKSSR